MFSIGALLLLVARSLLSGSAEPVSGSKIDSGRPVPTATATRVPARVTGPLAAVSLARPLAPAPTGQEARVEVAPGDPGGAPGGGGAAAQVLDGDGADETEEIPSNGDATKLPLDAIDVSLSGQPGTDPIDAASPVSLTPDSGQDGSLIPGLMVQEPVAPGPAYPEAVFLPLASADVMQSIAVDNWDAVDFGPFVDIGGKDLGMAEMGVYRTETPDEAFSYYRRQLREAGWTLYADVGDSGHPLMYMRDSQVLVKSELDEQQVQYFGEDSDGFVLVTFERYGNSPFDSPQNPLSCPNRGGQAVASCRRQDATLPLSTPTDLCGA